MTENDNHDEHPLPPPNYTQMPNLLIDYYAPLLSNAGLRVVLAIARKTFGWHKKKDEISLSQLMEATGMTKASCIKGANDGIALGIVRKITGVGGRASTYQLIVKDPENGVASIVTDTVASIVTIPAGSIATIPTKESSLNKVKDKDSTPPIRDGVGGQSFKSAKGKKQATKVEPDKPEVPALTADEYARFLKGIEYTFQVGDVRVNNIYHMLRGSSKKNGYKQYNLSPVMTLEELRQYADWRKRTYDPKLTPVQSPEKIADDISIFRKEQRVQALASIPPPAELFEDYSQYAPADGDIDLDLGYEDE